MISNFLLKLATDLINLFLGLLPVANSTVVQAINSSLSGFKSLLASLNWLFPVQAFISYLGIVFIMESVLFSYKLIKRVISLFSSRVA